MREPGTTARFQRMPPDLERLQTSLDDIAGTVAWAAKWIGHLEDDEIRFEPHSDRPILEAEVDRLRAVADALVPGRVRDSSTGRRWYLAPDDVRQRELDNEVVLDEADRKVERMAAETNAARDEAERSERRREDERRQREAQEAGRRSRVVAYLGERGPSTTRDLATGAGLAEAEVERAARNAGAKRGRDRLWRLKA